MAKRFGSRYGGKGSTSAQRLKDPEYAARIDAMVNKAVRSREKTAAQVIASQVRSAERTGSFVRAKGLGVERVTPSPSELMAMKAKAIELHTGQKISMSSDARGRDPATSKPTKLLGSGGDGDGDQPRVPAGNPDGGQWTK